MRIRPLPTIKGYTPIHTIGDGNCLFNSISLAWMDMEAAGLQNDDESLALLTSSFRKIHGDIPFNLEAIRNNPTEIQRLLSPVFRKLACNEAKEAEKIKCKRRTSPMLNTLKAYAEERLRKKWGIPLSQEPDDIFSVHPAIKDRIDTTINTTSQNYLRRAKFNLKLSDSRWKRFFSRFDWYAKFHAKKILINELNSSSADSILTRQQKEVSNWWKRQGGIEIFFDSMSQDKKWAGDIELNALAKLFQFNVTVLQAKQPPLKLIEEFDKRPTIYLHKSANHWTYCRKNQPVAVSSAPLLDATPPQKSNNSLTSLLSKFNIFKQSSAAKKPAPIKEQTDNEYLGPEKGKERI